MIYAAAKFHMKNWESILQFVQQQLGDGEATKNTFGAVEEKIVVCIGNPITMCFSIIADFNGSRETYWKMWFLQTFLMSIFDPFEIKPQITQLC